MMGRYQPVNRETLELNHVGIKVPQFSYSRLKGSNPVAHVEMASTGEVACLGDNLLEAFYQADGSPTRSHGVIMVGSELP